MKAFFIQHLPLFVSVVLLLSACNENADPKRKSPGGKIPLAEVTAVERRDMTSIIEITGTIQANIFTDVNAPVDGIVESLMARENQKVEKGSIIAVIDPIDRVSAISNNTLQIQRLEKALSDEGKTEEEKQGLLLELEKARSDLTYAENIYRTVPVVCPLSGLVTHRWTDRGSQVAAKDKLLTISDMRSLVIKAETNEKYFAAITQGRRLPLTLNAYPDRSLTGIIRLVYPQIDPVTRNVKFDIEILNFDRTLLPGMLAQIELPVTIRKQALSVPEEAVLAGPDGTRLVYIVDNDSIAHRRQVVTGIAEGGIIEITQGAAEHEMVVTSGQEVLKDKKKVTYSILPERSE
ncbi:MAG: efflux RND transporter periplasmic adaptor subunit [Bacteroidetes bacterium]|nr:efflux RND transporter periplasmic adaptor subunit [Bacteroidota bacterium]